MENKDTEKAPAFIQIDGSALRIPAARFTEPALKLFRKAGLPDDLDDGFVALDKKADAKSFFRRAESCGSGIGPTGPDVSLVD